MFRHLGVHELQPTLLGVRTGPPTQQMVHTQGKESYKLNSECQGVSVSEHTICYFLRDGQLHGRRPERARLKKEEAES